MKPAEKKFQIFNLFTQCEEDLPSFLTFIHNTINKNLIDELGVQTDNYLTQWVLLGLSSKTWIDIMSEQPFKENPKILVHLCNNEILEYDRNFEKIWIKKEFRESYARQVRVIQASRDFYTVRTNIKRGLLSKNEEVRYLANKILGKIKLLHKKYDLERRFSPWSYIRSAVSGDWPLVGTPYRGFDVYLVLIHQCYRQSTGGQDMIELENLFSKLADSLSESGCQ